MTREARNKVGGQLENLRIDFLKDQQTNHKVDPKKFWSTITSIIPNKKKSSTIISLKDMSPHSDIRQEKIAEFMNSFFTSVGPNLAQKHKDKWEYFAAREHHPAKQRRNFDVIQLYQCGVV